ncbi:nucleotide exchange factor GrpE [Agromyces mediolanus]|uniref:Protein GrpE n=1 Tax=Agromyces mediolanus TaxID=41986 RepID=A0A918CED2_AGRME|nr:nucleotide exchange factor GrpE [Agromyces mediolanus]GGR18429.1 protein GrpE [Agromyces mediolanus]GLJ71445.1 protein GrpE [Agromyces mediolanus]
MADENQNPDEPVIRDKRKIDPETGAVREPSSETDAAADAAASADEAELTVDDILNAAQAEVAEPNDEHLADLKRVTAEYANYRKRTEQNRELERDRAVGQTVAALLPVLDDLDRAEKHGDLEGDTAFGTIAAKLRQVTERLGLVRFGAVGEPFDPQLHEAIFQQPADDVEVDTVADVVETGYQLGEVQLRPAKVVVKSPQG